MRNRGPRQHVDRRNRDLERENERLKEELEKERREKEELHRQRDELDRESKGLKKDNEGLKKDNEGLKKDNEGLKKEKRDLKKQNKDLREQLAKLKDSLPQLAASDKTAEAGGVPSSKVFYRRNRQEGEIKKTGGQPGHPGRARRRPTPNTPPLHVTCDACPNCGGPLGAPIENAEQQRTITDIPLPSHVVYDIVYERYWCGHCGKPVRGETPWIPPMQHFGPGVASWIAYHRMLGLSVGKIRSSLYETYGLELSEATVLKLERWVADTLKEDYERLREELVKADVVNADETGFRIGGKNGWLWVFAYILGSFYVVAPTRGHKVPEEALKGFNGVLGRDAWKPYDFVKCSAHQLDLLHVNRWLERAEIKHGVEPRGVLSSKRAKVTRPGRPPERFLRYVNGVRSILKRAVEYSEGEPPPSPEERKEAAAGFRKEMKTLLDTGWKDKDAVRISKELRRRLGMLFTFVEREGVPWHNNDAERAIRPGVLARKISGGRRTWRGAEVYQVLLSITETSKKRGVNFISYVRERMGVPLSDDNMILGSASKS